VLDIRYASDDNFVGAPIDGYERPLCLLTPEAAAALVRANEIVSEIGYRLVVFDCYRPQRAVDHFVRWSYYPMDQKKKAEYYPNVDKRTLFELGYIASRSGHSRGSTADVGLTVVGDSGSSRKVEQLDMGTPFDYFDTISHTDSPDISGQQRQNRMILVETMKSAGFRNYRKEWWHFTLIGEPYTDTYFDVVVR
jgi:D-alanyl-D-alanine dipeptidase